VFFGEVAGEDGRVAVGDGDGVGFGGEAGGFEFLEVGVVAENESAVKVSPSAGTAEGHPAGAGNYKVTRVLWRGTGVYILGVRGWVSGFGGGRVTGVGGVAGDEDVLGGGALVFGVGVNGGKEYIEAVTVEGLGGVGDGFGDVEGEVLEVMDETLGFSEGVG